MEQLQACIQNELALLRDHKDKREPIKLKAQHALTNKNGLDSKENHSWGSNRMQNATHKWETKATKEDSTLLKVKNQHRFHSYADKQLKHLVIQEQFHFERIAQIMTATFPGDRTEYSERTCRERWTELHAESKDPVKSKELNLKEKRLQAIRNMSHPFTYYDAEEISIAKEHELLNGGDPWNVMFGDPLALTPEQTEAAAKKPVSNSGWNIFRNKIRIDPKNEEGYEERHQRMLKALEQAQRPQTRIEDSPLIFRPNYGQLAEFGMNVEELTAQRLSVMLEVPEEAERLLSQAPPEERVQGRAGGVGGARGRLLEGAITSSAPGAIEEDWDEYESD